MHFIFFFLVLGLYLAASVWIALKFSRFVPSLWGRVGVRVAVAVLSVLFVVQHLLAAWMPEWLNRVMYLVSTLWLVVVLYSVITMAVFGLARLIARMRNPELPAERPSTIWNTLLIVAIVIVAGMFNAYNPVFTTYDVSASSPSRQSFTTSVRIALVSDVHLGYAVRCGDAEKLVNMVNSTDADVCVIAGDFFDGDLRPVLNNDLGAPFRDIKTRFGTYAVLGNHDFMSNPEVASEYIRGLGITLLRDSALKVGPLWLIGRDDLSKARMGSRRLPLDSLACASLPQIVIDHQPGAVDESVAAGAILHLSGHTHAGQVWPMKFLTGLTYDVDYGHERIDSTDVIVTSGFGSWGPRVRLGNHAEVVVINLELN